MDPRHLGQRAPVGRDGVGDTPGALQTLGLELEDDREARVVFQ